MAGQLIKRGDSTWLVRVYLGRDARGKRKYLNRTVHGNKKAAERELTKVLRERDTGELFEATRQTVDEYLDTWLEDTARPGVRQRTYADYKATLRRYVRPYLGASFLAKLTPADLRRLYGKLKTEGLAPRTIRQAHEVFRNALEQAVEDGLLRSNPAAVRSVRKAIPPRRRREHQVVSRDNLAAFLEAATGDPWAAYWLVLLFGGLRPEEALALRWAD